ncbi:MAG: hypothetical protein K2X86_18715 [Cytophagaceae bacterium]|nr:hypothetical protein [Cytophagaceae bacterium]
MIKVKLFVNNRDVYIPLQEYLDQFHSTVSPAWDEYMDLVNEGLNISSEEEYQLYIKKMNLKKYDFENVKSIYKKLKNSELSQIFDDDILKFVSHLHEFGYFERIGNPELKDWLNIKGAFEPNKDSIPIDEKYSLMDLAKLKNGMNAIKYKLLFAFKW